MKLKFVVSTLSAFFVALASIPAQADMVTDAHGNVGYSTAAECDAAVHDGSAKFYQPFTQHKPLIRKGEKGVQPARIRNLGAEYKYGACDMGVGKKLNREGVSAALQGRYIPFSPDMPINAYSDATGAIVRVTMAQCDNWFSGNAPRPVAAPKPKPAPAPKPPVVTKPVRPPVVIPTPIVTPPSKTESGVRPYVFGTVGALHDGWKFTNGAVDPVDTQKSQKTNVAGQVGLGVQINPVLGVEAFYQNGAKHKYQTKNITGYQSDKRLSLQNQTFGARFTVGGNVTEKARLFAKAGVAGVKHRAKNHETDILQISNKVRARPTAGIGFTYDFNDHLAFRTDYDHVFKRNLKKNARNELIRSVNKNDRLQFKGSNYLGAGLQYKF